MHDDRVQPVLRGYTKPLPLYPKRRIANYELVEPIGKGGMAEVWVARRVDVDPSRPRPSKFAAIKLMADAKLGDPSYARMFQSEARLAMLLTHGNIVQTFDFGEESARSYIVMEWVDGTTLAALRHLLGRETPEFRHRLAAYATGQLLYALGYAHALTSEDGTPLRIVHRDVSPHNILVSTQGDIKLSDFGIAHSSCDESSGHSLKGKIRYMAPEQLSGKSRQYKVDLYAAGAIFHELLTGKKFRGHILDPRILTGLIYGGDLPDLPGIPPELDAVRRALLEPNQAKRIASAEEAGAMLRAWDGYGEMKHEVGKLVAKITGLLNPRSGFYSGELHSQYVRRKVNEAQRAAEEPES